MPQISKSKLFAIALRAGFIPSYANDAAYESAKGSSGTESERYWNTTNKIIREHDGTSWRDQQAGVAAPSVEHFTADDTLTEGESGKICTNKGATKDVILKLPNGSAIGTSFAFAIMANEKFTVSAHQDEKIWHGEGSFYYGNNIYGSSPGAVVSVLKIGTRIVLRFECSVVCACH